MALRLYPAKCRLGCELRLENLTGAWRARSRSRLYGQTLYDMNEHITYPQTLTFAQTPWHTASGSWLPRAAKRLCLTRFGIAATPMADKLTEFVSYLDEAALGGRHLGHFKISAARNLLNLTSLTAYVVPLSPSEVPAKHGNGAFLVPLSALRRDWPMLATWLLGTH